MAAKIFLTLVGLLYLGLSGWCSFAPETTSQKVGFEVQPGSGQSEYLTIYGGLELGMAILFLLPLIRNDMLEYSLLACLILHGCLVAFRTASFFVFSDVGGLTINLAIGEWIILLASVAFCWWTIKAP
jgi:hypothetical protein